VVEEVQVVEVVQVAWVVSISTTQNQENRDAYLPGRDETVVLDSKAN
tara:strand:- start:1325 stop:1465 length:141 start_codon:yes stop_codon:yes gene_type:complete